MLSLHGASQWDRRSESTPCRTGCRPVDRTAPIGSHANSRPRPPGERSCISKVLPTRPFLVPRLPFTSPQGPIFPNLYRPEAWVPSLYSPAAHARGHVAGYSASIAVRCPPSSSHSHGMQQRLGVSAAFPVGPLLCTRGRVAVRPSTRSGVPGTKAGWVPGSLRARRAPERGCSTLVAPPGHPLAASRALHRTRASSLRDPFAVAGVAVALPEPHGRAAGTLTKPPTAEADTWTRVPPLSSQSAAAHPWGSQLNFIAGTAVDSAGFGPVRGPQSTKSDRVWPVHRFNFPRLAAVLVTAVVAFVACAQGPGTPAGPPDTAPTRRHGSRSDLHRGEPISPLTLPEARWGPV